MPGKPPSTTYGSNQYEPRDPTAPPIRSSTSFTIVLGKRALDVVGIGRPGAGVVDLHPHGHREGRLRLDPRYPVAVGEERLAERREMRYHGMAGLAREAEAVCEHRNRLGPAAGEGGQGQRDCA